MSYVIFFYVIITNKYFLFWSSEQSWHNFVQNFVQFIETYWKKLWEHFIFTPKLLSLLAITTFTTEFDLFRFFYFFEHNVKRGHSTSESSYYQYNHHKHTKHNDLNPRSNMPTVKCWCDRAKKNMAWCILFIVNNNLCDPPPALMLLATESKLKMV